MTFFALITVLAAWGSLWLRAGTGLRVLLMVVFLALGSLLTLAGGLRYWWDSGMRPGQASALPMVCGLLTLASQTGAVLRGLLGGWGGTDWPESRPPRRR